MKVIGLVIKLNAKVQINIESRNPTVILSTLLVILSEAKNLIRFSTSLGFRMTALLAIFDIWYLEICFFIANV